VARSVLHVVEAMAGSLVEADLLARAARSAREALACDWTLIGLWEPSRQRFRGAASSGWPPVVDEQLPLFEFDPQNLDLIGGLLDGDLVEMANPPDNVRIFCRRWGVASFLAAPMRGPRGLLGALACGFRRRQGAFSPLERLATSEIAERVAVAAESVRLVEAMRRTSRLKTDILATISHELRTPLNAILGYSDLLRDGAMGPINAEQVQALDRIIFNARNVMEMAAMALDLNRLEAGRLAVHNSEFRLQDLLAELSVEFATPQPNQSVNLVWPKQSDVPTIYADRMMLKVALRNLINNALKFTPKGSVAVAVHCNRVQRRVRISVSDTGIGIPREEQRSIFDMFRQLESKPRTGSGVGLGLYLVRAYTELMGGTVSVESNPGRGSIFTVELPWQTPGLAAHS
jgi:signal transduction histidine kinase